MIPSAWPSGATRWLLTRHRHAWYYWRVRPFPCWNPASTTCENAWRIWATSSES